MINATIVFSRIALRNVRRNLRRSLLTVIAIAFGLFSLIVFQGLKQGLHSEMVASTVRLDAGILQVHAAGYEANLAVPLPLADPERVVAALGKLAGDGAARRLKSPALVLAGQRSSSVLLAGIMPAEERRVTMIGRRLVAGSYLRKPGTVLLGRELAKSLEVEVGSTVTLMAQSVAGKPALRRFTVGGIYQTALAAFDRSHVFLGLEDAQAFLNADDAITEIAVAGDSARAPEIAAALGRSLPPGQYQVRTWEEVAPDVKQLIELNDATMYLLVLIVFAIVAMGITNTMTTVIYERFRELGMMAAIGTPPGGIIAMIVYESLALGGFATLIGGAAGSLACLYLGRYGVDLTSFTSANQYFATTHVLKARLLAGDLVGAGAVTLLTAVAAGAYPAWKAASLRPVEALTHT